MRLYNRRLFEITYRYPEITAALAQGASACVLDGEIAVFVDGKPSFAVLAERDHLSDRIAIDYLARALAASYVVFDILYAKERGVMDLPLRERKQILREELQESEAVSIADSFPEKGEDYFGGLLLGAYRHGLLHYVGRVGSGFTDKELADIAAGFSPLDSSPFTNGQATPLVRWVKP